MQHSLGVGSGQAGTKLARDFQSLVRRQPPNTPQQRRQILAVHIFHGEERVPIHFAHVINPANIRMRNSPREPNLIAKTLQQSFIFARLFGKKLERNRLPQRQIIGAINFSHAAATQQCNDAIPPSQQASRKKSSLSQQTAGRTRNSRRT
jgi:hypothetical protein